MLCIMLRRVVKQYEQISVCGMSWMVLTVVKASMISCLELVKYPENSTTTY